ncbi:MAG TPA: DinB family protein [Gemmatimonadaceae bacterium]|nr:DinB family protein [Gemmatimonadaceae bacterium]
MEEGRRKWEGGSVTVGLYNDRAMFTDVQDFLRYYRGLHKRTMRDIAALPPEAADYRPPTARTDEGEHQWPIGEIVRHIGGARLYFSRAYRDEGWVFDGPARAVDTPADWIPVLEETWEEFQSRLADTPPEWLNRKLDMLDTDATLSGWRVLMMCAEHEVHHRSQIDTYAGIEGWDPPQIYGRSAEQVGAERSKQIAKHSKD